jgi:predicted DCC family thiol-disulfide oxidoreductase YuxK
VTAKSGIEQLGGSPDVRWVPYQSDEAARCLGRDYQPGRPDAAFLVEADGTIRTGLEAFVPLLPGLRGGRLLLALWRVPFLRPIARLLYRVMARNRYRWFGTVTISSPGSSR